MKGGVAKMIDMKNNELKKLDESLFSNETLNSLEMAELFGGNTAGNTDLKIFCKKDCPNAKCPFIGSCLIDGSPIGDFDK